MLTSNLSAWTEFSIGSLISQIRFVPKIVFPSDYKYKFIVLNIDFISFKYIQITDI